MRLAAGPRRLNPLPHAGTISVFLLGVVTVTGLYLTLFFEFGYEASYQAVASLEDHPIQRVMRALHRYSSAALVLTTVVHAWRIFVAGRFVGGHRRWRWATGVAALVLVWLAGVTGYWLVWDVRAQALNDATNALVGRWGWGAALVVRGLTGTGSGSDTLFLLWLAHLLLSAVVIWFAVRHLRRTRMAVLPPPAWMALMGGALLVVSLLLPVGMLAAADPSRALPDLPLDPFVLFLLPPLLTSWSWWWLVAFAALVAGVVALPRLLVPRPPPVVEIDAEACTGCELCVVDCPYEALGMQPRLDDRPLAVLDPSACVACGICVGACAFDAITLPGFDSPAAGPVLSPNEAASTSVVLVCDRHPVDEIASSPALAPSGSPDGDAPEPAATVRSVRCAGMVSPVALGHLYRTGAEDVRLVGCAPGDCRFGVGNRHAADRLAGTRAPQLPRRWSGRVTEDWVARGDTAALGRHGAASSVAAEPSRADGTGLAVRVGVVVLASVAAVAAATRAPFAAASAEATVRVVVDHTAGRALVVQPDTTLGSIEAVEIAFDGEIVGRRGLARRSGADLALLDWPLAPTDKPAPVEVRVILDDGDTVVATSSDSALAAGEQLTIELRDVPPAPDALDGERLFNARSTSCAVCHAVTPGDDGVGPSLAGVATVAGDRVEGLSAELYLRQSILLPDEYVVEGWPPGQMLPFYRDDLSEADLDALVAYLLTLEEEAG